MLCPGNQRLLPQSKQKSWGRTYVNTSIIFIVETSRRLFTDKHINILLQLLMGKLKGYNDFRQTLLGRKGVGKSAIMDAIFQACVKYDLAKYGLVCVQLLADVHRCTPTPSQAILSQLPLLHRFVLQFLLATKYSDTPAIRIIDEYLENHGFFAFGCIDDFQLVYRSSSQVAQETISELLAIGDSKRGRIHWILNGSSTDLQHLISAKLSYADAKKYPAYRQVDLNDTKYRFQTINPFLDNNKDFGSYLISRKHRSSQEIHISA